MPEPSQGRDRLELVISCGAAELRGIQPVVGTAGGKQLSMGSMLDDCALDHDDDPVGVTDGGQPVGDHEAGAPRTQRLHGPLHERLGPGIHRARRLVQDQDRRIGQESTRDRQQLALPRADAGTVVIYHRVVALRQSPYEMIDICRISRLADLRLGGVLCAISDVLVNGPAEQPGCLL